MRTHSFSAAAATASGARAICVHNACALRVRNARAKYGTPPHQQSDMRMNISVQCCECERSGALLHASRPLSRFMAFFPAVSGGIFGVIFTLVHAHECFNTQTVYVVYICYYAVC